MPVYPRRILVTTPHARRADDERRARAVAEFWGFHFVRRKGRPFRELLAEHQAEGVLVITAKEEVFWHRSGYRLFFHPGLAKMRLLTLRKGGVEWMIRAMDLREGETVVDANLGLANDALLLAFVSRRPVLGVEWDPVIAFITACGLRRYPFARILPEAQEAARRIRVICQDHRDFLRALPDKSVDHVYFSPMFVEPGFYSEDRMALRAYAPKDFVSEEAFREAFRVARRTVTVKLNRDRPPLPLPAGYRLLGSKRSTVEYAVWPL